MSTLIDTSVGHFVIAIAANMVETGVCSSWCGIMNVLGSWRGEAMAMVYSKLSTIKIEIINAYDRILEVDNCLQPII